MGTPSGEVKKAGCLNMGRQGFGQSLSASSSQEALQAGPQTAWLTAPPTKVRWGTGLGTGRLWGETQETEGGKAKYLAEYAAHTHLRTARCLRQTHRQTPAGQTPAGQTPARCHPAQLQDGHKPKEHQVTGRRLYPELQVHSVAAEQIMIQGKHA